MTAVRYYVIKFSPLNLLLKLVYVLKDFLRNVLCCLSDDCLYKVSNVLAKFNEVFN